MVRRVCISVLLCVLATGVSAVYAAHERMTPYGSDAVYFEQAAVQSEHVAVPQLSRIFGGVVTHHTPNAASLIVDFYARLRASGPVDTFVIVGPDHFERGRGTVTVSHAQFRTPFGVVRPDVRLIGLLEEGGFATHDEAAFDDHTVHSQLLAIARLFPEAEIVPLLFRSKGSNTDAATLGRFIASVAGPGTVVVAAVDFSHYLTTEQAMPLDIHAARTLSLIRPELAGVAEADSPQALTAMIAAVQAMGATQALTLGIHNSDEFSSRRDDVTTGYVVQMFGTPAQPRSFIGALDRMRYAVGTPIL